jgi:hypothetical protein
VSLIGLVIVLVIAGILLWAVGQIPMDATIAKLIRVVVIVVVVIWLLTALFPGSIGGLNAPLFRR